MVCHTADEAASNLDNGYFLWYITVTGMSGKEPMVSMFAFTLRYLFSGVGPTPLANYSEILGVLHG